MKKICILTILIIVFMVIVIGCEKPEDGLYSVIYHDNGKTSGFPPTDPNKYTTGSYAIALGEHTLVYSGYTFQHWNTRANGNGISYSEGDSIPIKYTNVFLYAVWLKDN
jgi:hypothetical protein